MIKFILLPALLISFTFQFIFSQWQTYQVTANIRFYDVSVVNQNTIWCSGDSGRVYRSTNGGQTWLVADYGLNKNMSVYKITAVDDQRAWILAILGNNRLFATTNGGLNWTEQFYSPVTYINKLYFFNSNTGYFISDPPTGNDTAGFFITRNGGQDWVRSVNSPAIPPGFFILDNRPNHLDTNFLWFFAEKSSGPPWVSRFYKLMGGLNNQWQYFDVNNCQCDMAVFKNGNEGLATDAVHVYSTTNGGANWTLKLTGTQEVAPTADFILVPGTEWVIHNSIRDSRISYDFCNSWQPVRNYLFWGYSDARDTNSIWIAGSNGQLLKYNFSFIGIVPASNEIPSGYFLRQNYPNPFNPVTDITIELPELSKVNLTVYDVLGRKVTVLINQQLKPGVYSVKWDGSNYPSGVYYYIMQSGEFRYTKKMILLK